MKGDRGDPRRRVTIAGHRSSDRGISSTVTHALALSITAILISGLLYTAGGLLEDQREHSAREQLDTVGNRIASDLSKAASLAEDGGNASFRASHPTSIAGQQYNVRLLTGSDCDSELFTTDTCLELELQDGRVQTMVPVRNESAVTFEVIETGVFRISADANGSAPPTSASRDLRDLRVGIGSDVGEFSSGSALNLTNRAPIAGFTFTPGQPLTSPRSVEFESDANDLDGQIVDYEWDLGDGTVVSGSDKESVDHSYSDPDKYTVTLTVSDDDGVTDEVSKVVSVGGLSYNDDATPMPLNASAGYDDGSIEFSVTNRHSADIVIYEVLVDPEDSTIDRIDAEEEADEIYVEGDVLAGGYSEPEDIYNDGRIFDIADDGLGPARLSGHSTADVSLEGFEEIDGSKADMGSEEVFVAMRYEVNGSYYTAQFTLNGAGGSNQPPVPSFDYDCTGTSCTFDDDGSDDPDGSVENFAWNFDDGTTISGPSETSVSHDFSANGTYDVSLTVTDDSGVSATVTETVLVGDPGPPVVFAVNAGGDEMTAGGVTYQEDTTSNPHPFHVGDNFEESTGDTIENTSFDGLYQTTRHGENEWGGDSPGSFGYAIPVPDGEYRVTFRFAEIRNLPSWWPREFDVELESSEEISDLNVDEAVGEEHALNLVRTVDVSDGELSIEPFPESNTWAPMVNAIVVEQLDAVAFQEDDETSEQVVMEAESYHRAVPGNHRDASGDDMSGDSWVTVSDASASGGTALDGQPNNGDSAGDTRNGPRLDYYVDVANTGTYYVWVRMNCPGAGSADDSVHVGLNGEPATFGESGLNKNASMYCRDESGWMWASHASGSPVSVDINSVGQHTVNVWMNDDGTQIDQVVLTTDSSYDPTVTPPSESPES